MCGAGKGSRDPVHSNGSRNPVHSPRSRDPVHSNRGKGDSGYSWGGSGAQRGTNRSDDRGRGIFSITELSVSQLTHPSVFGPPIYIGSGSDLTNSVGTVCLLTLLNTYQACSLQRLLILFFSLHTVTHPIDLFLQQTNDAGPDRERESYGNGGYDDRRDSRPYDRRDGGKGSGKGSGRYDDRGGRDTFNRQDERLYDNRRDMGRDSRERLSPRDGKGSGWGGHDAQHQNDHRGGRFVP